MAYAEGFRSTSVELSPFAQKCKLWRGRVRITVQTLSRPRRVPPVNLSILLSSAFSFIPADASVPHDTSHNDHDHLSSSRSSYCLTARVRELTGRWE